MSDERCQWLVDPDIGLWHLPGCWGSVVGGPECCYCDPETLSIDDRLSALEGQIRHLATILGSHHAPDTQEVSNGREATGGRPDSKTSHQDSQ